MERLTKQPRPYSHQLAIVNAGQTNGDVQLIDVNGQPGGTLGRLEIFINGQWGTICTAGFDERDAQVACRQLGFDNYIFEGVARR